KGSHRIYVKDKQRKQQWLIYYYYLLGAIKQLKKLGIVHLEARKGQRLYAYYVSVASDWKHIKYLF
ncbi:hypothetical protein, partial [Helicobacter pylori]